MTAKKEKKNKEIEIEDLDRDTPLYPHQKLNITLPIPPSI